MPVGNHPALYAETLQTRTLLSAVAVNDLATTNEDTAVNISVLSNDTGGPAQISIWWASYGSAMVNDAGTPGDFTDDSIDFDPEADYFGPDAEVWYELYDGFEYSGPAQVAITVNSVNDAPVAVADTGISTSEDQPVSVYVLSDDSDVEGDPLTIVVTAAVNGTATVNNSGTPSDPTDDWVDFVPTAEFSGSAQFTYKVNDGTVDSAVVTVPVNVTSVNDAPVAADDNSIATLEDTLVNINVLANDSDAEGDPLQITIGSSPYGTATVNDAGTPLDYSDDTVDFVPDANYFGPADFEYGLFDGTDYSETATVSVTVNAVNDAPVAVADPDISTSEDQAVSVYVLGDDSDAEGDPLTIIVTAATNGTATVNNSGTPSDPSDDWVDFTPTAEFSGTAQFSYKVNDGTVDSSIVTVLVSVMSVNDAPVAVDDSVTTPEDTPINIDVLANDSDGDGDPLQIRISTMSTPYGGTAIVNDNGTTSDYTDDTVDFDPDEDFNGSAYFYYDLYDGQEYSSEATVTINITPVNDAPVAVADPDISTSEDQAVSVYVLGDDSDAEGDPLTIIVTAATNGTATVNNSGTPSDPTDDWVDFTPTAEFSGTAQFSYKVNDGTVDSAIVTVLVSVMSVNDAPVAVDDSVTTPEDTLININVLANDTDADGDPLQITILSSTDGTATESSGVVTYTPNADFNGTDSFTYTLSDGNGGTDTATVSVTVSAVNDAPVATDDPDGGSFTTTATSLLTLSGNDDILSNDSDVDAADTISITSVASSSALGAAVMLNNDGSVTYDPTVSSPLQNLSTGEIVTDTFTYTISDVAGLTDMATVSVDVSAYTPDLTGRLINIDIDSDNDGDIDIDDDSVEDTEYHNLHVVVDGPQWGAFDADDIALLDPADFTLQDDLALIRNAVVDTLVGHYVQITFDAEFRVWADSDKTTEIYTGDLFSIDLGTVPSLFYVEGLDPLGDGTIAVALLDPAMNELESDFVQARRVKNKLAAVNILATYKVPASQVIALAPDYDAMESLIKDKVYAEFSADDFDITDDYQGIHYEGVTISDDTRGSSGFIVGWKIEGAVIAGGSAYDFSAAELRVMAFYVVLENIDDVAIRLKSGQVVDGPDDAEEHEKWHTDGYPVEFKEILRDEKYVEFLVEGSVPNTLNENQYVRKRGYRGYAHQVAFSNLELQLKRRPRPTDKAPKDYLKDFFEAHYTSTGALEEILYSGLWHKADLVNGRYQLLDVNF
jgi:VCBS repeat-containing protein